MTAWHDTDRSSVFLQGKDAPLEVCAFLSFVTGTASLLNSGAGDVSTASCKYAMIAIVFAFLNLPVATVFNE